MLQEILDSIRTGDADLRTKFISKCIEQAAKLGMATPAQHARLRIAYVKAAEVLEFFKREGFIDDFDLTSKLHDTPERYCIKVLYEMDDEMVEVSVTINLE